MNIKIILTPYFLDQHLTGLEELAKPDWIVNHQELPKDELIIRMSALHAGLAHHIETALREGQLPISLAGDCCTTTGVLAGFQRVNIDPLLIWFDAHGDFNTWETSPSGFLGGMPLAMLAGLGEQTLLKRLEINPLPQDDIILTDGRDLDPGEKELVNSSNIKHLEQPLDLLKTSFEDRPIWVHFDTDVVNPEQSPAQNYPASGGPGKEELAQVFQHLAETGLIKAVSLSSWAPNLPGADLSRTVSMDLLNILIRDSDQ